MSMNLEVQERESMKLSAVVCFIPSALHYTCYIKDSAGWLYADGLANQVRNFCKKWNRFSEFQFTLINFR